MPRTAIYTRNQIAKKTLHLIKERGPASFTARDVGSALGTSSRPIFTAFENMEDLRNEVFRLSAKIYNNFIGWDSEEPISYKEYGLRLIRFCQKEHNLAQFSLECVGNQLPSVTDPITARCIENLRSQLQLTDEQFHTLFLHHWALALGIATQCSVAKIQYTDEQILDMFDRQIIGLLYTFNHPDPVNTVKNL